MADTRPTIPLTGGVKTDIYAALNAQAGFPAVTVGAAIAVQNIGSSDVRLTTKATIPLATDGFTLLPTKEQATNVTPSTGEWAESLITDGLIIVRVI
jgi:hypothetical protein